METQLPLKAGYARLSQADWFLIKDSARSSRIKKPYGYLYYRGDYIQLKMLSFMVHKDAAKAVSKECERAAGKSGRKPFLGGLT